MELHLNIVGLLLMLLALAHIGFPKYFKWKQELQDLRLLTRQMFQIHTLFIAFTVFLMGLLCVTSSAEIIETTLGKRIALGLGIFWMIRFFIQLFGYSTKLWKGKTFETAIHIIFSLLWLYVSVVFLFIYVH